MKYMKNVPVYLLAVILVVFSLQFFFMVFMKQAMPSIGAMGDQYFTLLFTSGYIWVVKGLELALGLMLFSKRWQSLALILIAPITLNIVLSEVLIIAPPVTQMIPAFLVLILNAIAIYQRRAVYMPIVAKQA